MLCVTDGKSTIPWFIVLRFSMRLRFSVLLVNVTDMKIIRLWFPVLGFNVRL